ncbi:hypothetical protein DENSPDRAFT_44694 [Dentipellis sp. KUC8613]|nr:hypothetical protein DENSPDRAFT_44694 [Dentipellis sp. KUC8613]
MTDWSCSFCSKIFVRKGDLNRHELLHTGIKPHVCGTCGKGFAQSCALKTHLNTHTGNKPYRCNAPGCKAAFGDPSSRTRHRKERHGKAQSHQCPVPGCNSSIKRTSTFKAHLRTHGLDPNTVLDPKKFPSTKRVPVMSPRPRKTSPELVQIPTLMPSNDSSISKSTLSPTNTPCTSPRPRLY